MTMETLIYHPQWQDFYLTGPLSAGLPGRELLGKWKGRDQSILENAASVLKHAKAFPNGDLHRGIPNNWLVYFMENPNRKWMMNSGTPISGNLQMYESKPWYPRYPNYNGWFMDVYSPSNMGIIGLNWIEPPTKDPETNIHCVTSGLQGDKRSILIATSLLLLAYKQNDEQCWGIPKQGDAQIMQNYDLNSIRKKGLHWQKFTNEEHISVQVGSFVLALWSIFMGLTRLQVVIVLKFCSQMIDIFHPLNWHI